MNNTPINTLQQLMAITAEECGELTQVCMKHLRKFETVQESVDTNPDTAKWNQKLIEEAGDVMCMIELLVEHGMLTTEQLADRANVKRQKLKEWSDLIQ